MRGGFGPLRVTLHATAQAEAVEAVIDGALRTLISNAGQSASGPQGHEAASASRRTWLKTSWILCSCGGLLNLTWISSTGFQVLRHCLNNMEFEDVRVDGTGRPEESDDHDLMQRSWQRRGGVDPWWKRSRTRSASRGRGDKTRPSRGSCRSSGRAPWHKREPEENATARQQ